MKRLLMFLLCMAAGFTVANPTWAHGGGGGSGGGEAGGSGGSGSHGGGEGHGGGEVMEPVLVTVTETRTTLFPPMVRDLPPPGTKERVIMGIRTVAQAIWRLRTMATHVT